MEKHIVNKANDWAKESLRGYVLGNNKDVVVLDKYPNVLVRRDYVSLAATSSRVALISGGGSGHEPAHVGFVGHGMLTAVVCGDLFASPSVASILAAVRFVAAHNNNSGVLLIVKNYTGDRLNFGMAAKRAQFEGILVDWLLVDDDVALITDHTPGEESQKQEDSSVGRRGLCGTLFVHKLAGALAEQRKSLSEIKSTLESILNECKNLRTIGVSLSGSIPLPGAEKKTTVSQSLGCDQIEIGMGIHGENGRHRMAIEKSAKLTKYLLDEYLFKSQTHQNSEQQFCLIVNNLGGLSVLETYVLVNDCVRCITEQKLGKIRRLYVGTLMTSLNMNGFSLTMLKLDQSNSENILELLDQKTSAPAWPKTYGSDVDFTELGSIEYSLSETNQLASLTNEKQFFSLEDGNILKFYLKTIAEDFASSKDYLNELDTGCGDGDCGNSLASAAEKILKCIDDGTTFSFAYPHQVLLSCANIFESCGGSLCILLALFFTSAASSFRKNIDSLQTSAKDLTRIDWLKLWSSAINNGMQTVEEYGRARPGQRSIVDPLNALNQYLKSEASKTTMTTSSDLDVKAFFQQMVDVTFEAAQSTAKMKPMVGRASYVDPSLIKNPDAGAFAISIVVSLIYKAFLTYNSSS